MTKRGYNKEFTPQSDTYHRYLLDTIPVTLWKAVQAKSKREGVSVRAFLLTSMKAWVTREDPSDPTPELRGSDRGD